MAFSALVGLAALSANHHHHQLFEKCAKEVLLNAAINKVQGILMVSTYVMFTVLTWTQLGGLLKLINTLCGPQVIPASKVLFRRIWRCHKNFLCSHFFCESCFSYLGTRN